MTHIEQRIARLYAAFNERRVEDALMVMSEDVSWPKASEGGRVVGKEEIRTYWGRQWKEFDPHVEPIEVTEWGPGQVEVRVHQLVKSLNGEVLSDSEVRHVYTMVDDLVERMDLGASGADSEQSPSSTFVHH